MNHIMLGCVFARTIWTMICTALGRANWTPGTDDTLQSWCLNKDTVGHQPRDIRAILILGLWVLWKHRNLVVFDGVSPSVTAVAAHFEVECRAWCEARFIKGGIDQFLGVVAAWVRRE